MIICLNIAGNHRKLKQTVFRDRGEYLPVFLNRLANLRQRRALERYSDIAGQFSHHADKIFLKSAAFHLKSYHRLRILFLFSRDM